ncbi:hypothetical protein [Plantactinospora sp. KBS50]|uniref:hypothetical protein n=1 Tax=Plantactinospora sp. KBS50 TaxID=2024580 RepID=UPI001E4C0150|nr:hypothetical protein [Plantactinospora sp. KBS50]
MLAVAAAITALFCAVAVTLSGRRDVGAGLLPDRLGRAGAPAGLGSPLGLAWRLHRSLLVSWTTGFVLLGLVFGSVTKSVQDMVSGNSDLEQIFARLGGASGLVDAYLASTMNLLGLIAAGYAIQATLRMRAEEAGGRAEPLLGTAVGRLGWAASHLLFSLLGPAVVLAAAGVATGLTAGAVGDGIDRMLPRVLAGALVQLPAVWVLVAIAVALFGFAPGWPRSPGARSPRAC